MTSEQAGGESQGVRHLEYSSKTDAIVRAVRQQIIDGTFPPGASLRQRDLAQRFQVSATPIREALNQLRVEGYVETQLHRGATVVREPIARRKENWRIRAKLESLAAELAAERMTPADLADASRLATSFAEATDDLEAGRLNKAFHFRIYQVAGSPVLLQFLTHLWQSLDVVPSALRDRAASAREHFAILDALEAHDGALASELIADHILMTASSAERAEPNRPN